MQIQSGFETVDSRRATLLPHRGRCLAAVAVVAAAVAVPSAGARPVPAPINGLAHPDPINGLQHVDPINGLKHRHTRKRA